MCVCVCVCVCLPVVAGTVPCMSGTWMRTLFLKVIRCNWGLIVYESKNLRKVYRLFPTFSPRLSGGSRSWFCCKTADDKEITLRSNGYRLSCPDWSALMKLTRCAGRYQLLFVTGSMGMKWITSYLYLKIIIKMVKINKCFLLQWFLLSV